MHLIKPEEDIAQDVEDGANRSPFFNLDSQVSEGVSFCPPGSGRGAPDLANVVQGGNFSQGQRQYVSGSLCFRSRLICPFIGCCES